MWKRIRRSLDTLKAGFRRHDRGPVRINVSDWGALRACIPFIATLDATEEELLKNRAAQFLESREFVGIDFDLQPWQQRVIAAYAALPVLHLGIEAYDSWRTVLVYPDTFAPEQEWVDEDGIAHHAIVPQAGEAWERGPVILSWADVAADGAIIVHEMLHALDSRQEGTNGFPELNDPGLSRRWTRSFRLAYADLQDRIARDEDPPIDPYAATAPAEFLAVAGEYFFFEPACLMQVYPEIYGLLAERLRQDPLRRRASIDTALEIPGPWHTLRADHEWNPA